MLSSTTYSLAYISALSSNIRPSLDFHLWERNALEKSLWSILCREQIWQQSTSCLKLVKMCQSAPYDRHRMLQTSLIISLICNKCVTTQIWHFLVTGIERNICRCTFNRYSVITRVCKTCVIVALIESLKHFKTFKHFSCKITNFELWHSCHKWATHHVSLWMTWHTFSNFHPSDLMIGNLNIQCSQVKFGHSCKVNSNQMLPF